jgi:hypothetical protein
VLLGPLSLVLAATGDPLILVQSNAANRLTALAGSAKGRALRIINEGTGPVLDLRMAAGQSPLKVNAEAGKAANLIADRVDGFDGNKLLDPRAYAKVDGSGNLIESASKGIVGFEWAAAPANRVYCFGLEFTPKVAVASPFISNRAVAATATKGTLSGTGCAAPFDDAVRTFGSNDGSIHADVRFVVIFA